MNRENSVMEVRGQGHLKKKRGETAVSVATE